jgi:hypothetical protein
MSKKQEIDWGWWWEQVLLGVIHESAYRKARLENYYMQK